MSNEQIRHALELGLKSASDLMSEAPRSIVMQISPRIDAIRAALNSLAATPPASGAGDERAAFEADTLDLYPVATFNRFASGRYNIDWIENQWGGWQRRAAIAAQAKPQQMSDKQIDCLAVPYVGLGGVENYRAFARDIIANSAPNKALVEALQLAHQHLDWALPGEEYRGISGKIKAALKAAGVETGP